ncbi:MAG: hypothetical protein KDA96_02675 [Planctomycetaceae bacterium]|nr:hypothetical protein [Planctomycetaceae bacterium]
MLRSFVRTPSLDVFRLLLRGWVLPAIFALLSPGATPWASGEVLLGGAARVDITNRDAGPVNGPLHARALVLKSGDASFVLITVDAVAIGEIGHIDNEYLSRVRDRLQQELGIAPANVIANASHCHGIVCRDVDERTVEAVRLAAAQMVPVTIGTGTGYEDRIMENRRLRLKSGRTVDVRHAYSLPPDDDVAEVGPVDPQIGVLRIDRVSGGTLAVVYNFACHPIQGMPGGPNTADITGFSSQVIEDNLGPGCTALFVQGCGGDINPVFYKDVDHPRSAEPLGNMLGLSTLKAVRSIECSADSRLQVQSEMLALPRGDRTDRIVQLEAEQLELLRSLRGTSLSLKTFMPLAVKHGLSKDFPSYYSHRYLHDDAIGRSDLRSLDAENRRNLEAYMKNIHVMEELTRLQTNLTLLRKHQAEFVAAGSRTVDVELTAVRIGDFVMVTFPGELTVQIGLNLKEQSPHKPTFVAGYTNGYIYYAPTTEQLLNVGGAQEDSDCILDADWQPVFESKAIEMLKKL